jgi:hypothetical protein
MRTFGLALLVLLASLSSAVADSLKIRLMGEDVGEPPQVVCDAYGCRILPGPQPDTLYYVGTCFCVGGYTAGHHILLTNEHVIMAAKRPLGPPEVEVEGRWLPVRVLLAEFPPDLAVLELAYEGHLDCYPLAAADVQPGDKVRVSGTTSGISYRSIIGRRPDPQTGAIGIAFRGVVEHGDSGGLVENEEGAAVGIVALSSYTTRLGPADPEAFTWFVPASRVRADILRQNWRNEHTGEPLGLPNCGYRSAEFK